MKSIEELRNEYENSEAYNKVNFAEWCYAQGNTDKELDVLGALKTLISNSRNKDTSVLSRLTKLMKGEQY